MVEGHGVHRVAERHRRLLLGKVFKAVSPNGKFKEGASLINKRTLSRIEAIGKNLFYFWDDANRKAKSDSPTVVHIHFGMSGQFKTASLGTLAPTPNTRLELVNEEDNLVAHLSAMTCKHGGLDFYESKRKSLGQDPLREDADKELVWEAFKKSRKSVGMLLMDQNVIAGVGNIYRAEILFKAGVHPETLGSSIDYDSFNTIWDISKDLLHRGFQTGSILTVDPEEGLPPPWTRRYIYNHAKCGRCGSKVRTWDMGGRTCYACPTCQVLNKGDEIPQKRTSELGKAKDHVPFLSHCAPEAPASALQAALEKIEAGEKRNVEHIALVEEDTIELGNLSKMTVKALKARLAELNLPTSGRKDDLLKRLAATYAPSAGVDGAEKKDVGRKPPPKASGRIAFKSKKRRV